MINAKKAKKITEDAPKTALNLVLKGLEDTIIKIAKSGKNSVGFTDLHLDPRVCKKLEESGFKLDKGKFSRPDLYGEEEREFEGIIISW